MTESKIYELFTELMSECWEWAYDHPERAVAYYDGAYTMALKIIENLDEYDKLTLTQGGVVFEKARVLPDLKPPKFIGKEVST